MKIAFVYDAIYPWVKGGAEKRIYEIGRRLAERGNEVHLFGVKWWEGEDIIEFEGMVLHGVCDSRELYTNGRRSITQALSFSTSLFRPLLKDEFDVIDVSVFPYFSCFTAKSVSVAKRTPLVFTWHEVWDDYWYEYMGRIGIFGWVVERIVSKLSKDNIAVSRWTKAKMETIGIKTKNICVIPNGIDLEQIQRIKPSSEQSDIVFAGRLIKEKNVDLLLRVVSILKNSTSDIRCIIMGDGPEKERLLHLTEELRLEDNILFTGFIEYDELIGNIKASRVLVLPSKREGFGIVAIESFACGKPVVTVNCKDNAAQEIVVDSVNGFVVKAEKEEIAKNLTTILNNEVLYGKLVRNVTQETEKYSWEKICNSSTLVYGNIDI